MRGPARSISSDDDDDDKNGLEDEDDGREGLWGFLEVSNWRIFWSGELAFFGDGDCEGTGGGGCLQGEPDSSISSDDDDDGGEGLEDEDDGFLGFLGVSNGRIGCGGGLAGNVVFQYGLD